MADIVFSVFSLLAVFLTIPPFIWHWRNKNVAAVSLLFWIFLANLIYFLNSVIWANSITSFWNGKVYCDIVIKLLCGYSVGVLGATAAIERYLAQIMRKDAPSHTTPESRRKRVVIELAFSFAVPILMMSLHYIVQPSRFMIMGVNGCVLTCDRSWPSFVLLLMWPTVFAAIASVYAILVIYRFFRRRNDFKALLSRSQHGVYGINSARFMRLLLYSLFQILVYFPLSLYVLVGVNAKVPLLPYSWSAIHDPSDWDIIINIPMTKVSPQNWCAPASGIMSFLMFGIGSDALKMYKGWWTSFKKFTLDFMQMIRRILRCGYHDGKDIGITSPMSYEFDAKDLGDTVDVYGSEFKKNYAEETAVYNEKLYDEEGNIESINHTDDHAAYGSTTSKLQKPDNSRNSTNKREMIKETYTQRNPNNPGVLGVLVSDIEISQELRDAIHPKIKYDERSVYTDSSSF